MTKPIDACTKSPIDTINYQAAENDTPIDKHMKTLTENNMELMLNPDPEHWIQVEPESTTAYIDQLLRMRKKKVYANNSSNRSRETLSIHDTLEKVGIEDTPKQWTSIWEDFEINPQIYKYIADIKIMYNREVVNCLASECNIELLERDLETPTSLDEVETLPQHLEKTDRTSDELDNTMTVFTQALIRMRNRYENIWVVLEGYVKTKNSFSNYLGFDPFAPYVQEAVTELHTFAAYARIAIDLNVEILYSFSPQDSAHIARMLGDMIVAFIDQPTQNVEFLNSQQWQLKKSWKARDWLFEEESTVKFIY
ncbi:hypothetical protein K7432_011281 [Basidiobolus ranarum]|uniref:Uncharacterized protein n=1 Tax=Basidiobolus ranarum TaxID=34480 RepID=A0ABR2WML3_9FUNG